MKKILALTLLLPILAVADGNVPPNGAAPVSIVSNVAATLCVESVVAAGSAISATVPALSGNYFYITNISNSINAIAAPAATLYPTTSSNVPGSYSIRQAAQATVFNINFVEAFPIPLKSSVVGTAVVFTGTALANVSAGFRVCGFYAP